MAAVEPANITSKQAVWSKKPVRETISVFGIKIAALVAGFLSISLLAKMVPQQDLGLYLLIFSLSGFFGICMQFGLGSATLKLVAEMVALGQKANTGQTIAAAFRNMLIGFGIFAILWLLGADGLVLDRLFSVDSTMFISAILLIWSGLFAAQKLISESLRGLHMTRAAVLFDGAGSALILAVGLLAMFALTQKIQLETALVLAVLAVVCMVVTGFYLLQKSTGFLSFGVKAQQYGMLVLAAPMFLTEIAIFMNNYADLWVIAAFLPAQEVASYGVVLRVAMLVMLPSIVVNAIIAPKIIHLNATGNLSSLNRLLGLSAMFAFVPTLFMVILLFLFGQLALEILFGTAYSKAFGVLMVLCAGRLINVFTGSCGLCLLLCGQAKKMMVSTVIFSAISLILALVLVNKYGAMGVASGFAIGMAGQNIIQYLMVKKLLKVSSVANIWLLIPQNFASRKIVQGAK